MNIQRKNSAHHFRMQSEREQTLVAFITPALLTYIHMGEVYELQCLIMLFMVLI